MYTSDLIPESTGLCIHLAIEFQNSCKPKVAIEDQSFIGSQICFSCFLSQMHAGLVCSAVGILGSSLAPSFEYPSHTIDNKFLFFLLCHTSPAYHLLFITLQLVFSAPALPYSIFSSNSYHRYLHKHKSNLFALSSDWSKSFATYRKIIDPSGYPNQTSQYSFCPYCQRQFHQRHLHTMWLVREWTHSI